MRCLEVTLDNSYECDPKFYKVRCLCYLSMYKHNATSSARRFLRRFYNFTLCINVLVFFPIFLTEFSFKNCGILFQKHMLYYTWKTIYNSCRKYMASIKEF